eukprot:972250-Prymnesium_polylepis.1
MGNNLWSTKFPAFASTHLIHAATLLRGSREPRSSHDVTATAHLAVRPCFSWSCHRARRVPRSPSRMAAFSGSFGRRTNNKGRFIECAGAPGGRLST